MKKIVLALLTLMPLCSLAMEELKKLPRKRGLFTPEKEIKSSTQEVDDSIEALSNESYEYLKEKIQENYANYRQARANVGLYKEYRDAKANKMWKANYQLNMALDQERWSQYFQNIRKYEAAREIKRRKAWSAQTPNGPITSLRNREINGRMPKKRRNI